jgi:hypothetical protein
MSVANDVYLDWVLSSDLVSALFQPTALEAMKLQT